MMWHHMVGCLHLFFACTNVEFVNVRTNCCAVHVEFGPGRYVSRSPRSARLAARARVSGALASQNAPRCIIASSCCNTPGYIVYIECTQAGGRANLEQPTRPSKYMHACNFLLVRIFETNFLLNRNPERQIVCCIRFKKIF